MVRWTELWSNLQIVRLSYGKNRDQSFQLSDADNCWEPQPCHPVTCRHRWLKTNSKTQPPASNGWVALSSMFGCSFVCLSRIGNTSSHLHYMMFQTIQTIYFTFETFIAGITIFKGITKCKYMIKENCRELEWIKYA